MQLRGELPTSKRLSLLRPLHRATRLESVSQDIRGSRQMPTIHYPSQGDTRLDMGVRTYQLPLQLSRASMQYPTMAEYMDKTTTLENSQIHRTIGTF